MAIGLVGRKCGMTRVFTEDGRSIPVTVIQALPNRITRIKTPASDGYAAIQVTTGTVKAQRLSRVDEAQLGEFEAGSEITVESFEAGQKVDVAGTSIGKGYAGAIKRHNFKGQDTTHGNSLSHRAPGSIGQNQTPGRVFKGKKMSGHLGNERVTTQNLEIVSVDAERNLLLVKGSVPGHKDGRLYVKPSVKAKA